MSIPPTTNSPALSVCIPAFNRPEGLRKAICSIIESGIDFTTRVEIVISDDSTNRYCEEIAKTILEEWEGAWKYIHNDIPLGMARNWNSTIRLSSGEYVWLLHDDDRLKKHAIKKALTALGEKASDNHPVRLFGVDIVDSVGKKTRDKRFSKAVLSKEEAFKSVLLNSSFVRFPGVILNRSVFEEVGYFNEDIGETADLEMWIRLFGHYGVSCHPEVVGAYTIHDHALTNTMFTPDTVEKISRLFSLAQESNLLSKNEIDMCKANFLSQFILAGAFRSLKKLNFKDAKIIFKMLSTIDITKNQVGRKWKAIEIIMGFLLFEKGSLL